MKKILVAIDYNPSAQKVAETGHTFAKILQGKITFVHVVSDEAIYMREYIPFMGYDEFKLDRSLDLIEELKNKAKEFLNASVAHFDDITIGTQVLEGDTDDAILEYANQWKADLIVLGTHSHRRLETLLIGSVTASVLKQTKIPLLIIPTKD